MRWDKKKEVKWTYVGNLSEVIFFKKKAEYTYFFILKKWSDFEKKIFGTKIIEGLSYSFAEKKLFSLLLILIFIFKINKFCSISPLRILLKSKGSMLFHVILELYKGKFVLFLYFIFSTFYIKRKYIWYNQKSS